MCKEVIFSFRVELGKETLSLPSFFFLAEDVLSRGITKLVDSKKIKLIKATKNTRVPSHVLYADKITLLCKEDSKTIDEIKNLFSRYANLSSQSLNNAKSIVYMGSMTHQRHLIIAQTLGFTVGVTPFMY